MWCGFLRPRSSLNRGRVDPNERAPCFHETEGCVGYRVSVLRPRQKQGRFFVPLPQRSSRGSRAVDESRQRDAGTLSELSNVEKTFVVLSDDMSYNTAF